MRGKTGATVDCGAAMSAGGSPSAPRRPAYPRWCSIAAVSCSTAASRRWPTPPAKADWSSKWLTKPTRPPRPAPSGRGASAGRGRQRLGPEGRRERGPVAAVAAVARRRRQSRPWRSRRQSRPARRPPRRPWRRRRRRRGADREAGPHQPRLQDGEGRQALRLRRAGRGRRRQGPRRLRPWQGARGARGDLQGDRGGQEGDGPRAAARGPHAAP